LLVKCLFITNGNIHWNVGGRTMTCSALVAIALAQMRWPNALAGAKRNSNPFLVSVC
jgi:hypothetical protein